MEKIDKREILRLRSEAVNCERIAESQPEGSSMADTLRKRAAELRSQADAMETALG